MINKKNSPGFSQETFLHRNGNFFFKTLSEIQLPDQTSVRL